MNSINYLITDSPKKSITDILENKLTKDMINIILDYLGTYSGYFEISNINTNNLLNIKDIKLIPYDIKYAYNYLKTKHLEYDLSKLLYMPIVIHTKWINYPIFNLEILNNTNKKIENDVNLNLVDDQDNKNIKELFETLHKFELNCKKYFQITESVIEDYEIYKSININIFYPNDNSLDIYVYKDNKMKKIIPKKIETLITLFTNVTSIKFVIYPYYSINNDKTSSIKLRGLRLYIKN